MVFRMSLVAVPAFMRVEPVITSGPTSGAITTSCALMQLLGRRGAQQEAGARTALARALQRAMHEGRGAGGGDAQHEVVGAYVLLVDGRGAVLGWSSAPSCARSSAS